MHELVRALSRPEAYPHGTEDIQIAETHISWIFLTGTYAYKIKKPVNLGFLDFSTPEKRAFFCGQELTLNRRLCPELYLDVVPVTRSGSAIRIGGSGTVIEHAVKMVQFDRSQELDRLLATNRLTETHIDSVTRTVTAFHRAIPAAGSSSEYGRPEKVILPLLDNFSHTAGLVSGSPEEHLLEKLKEWTLDEHNRLLPLFLERKNNGFIRHCHGDMHTGNMVWHCNRVLIFDCIEFNPSLFMIDVISDAAFLFMDLEHGGRPELAWRFLGAYLSGTGDYEALRLLRFYSLYRAMVRAKVTAIRYTQECPATAKHAIREEHLSYIRQAHRYTVRSRGRLIITSGVSGSGKSMHAGRLAPLIPAIHIRSDIERKRLAGLEAGENSQSRNLDIYTPGFTEKTYRRLEQIVGICLEEGFSVLVDATFLASAERLRFRELARRYNCAFTILHFHAPEKLLRERIRMRLRKGGDPSEADENVLLQQLATQDPLSKEELPHTVEVDTGNDIVDYASIVDTL
ncbi:MAG: hypothetical protein FJZ79_00865 [Chlorobi bacterium]|nr:hypothetical protein [Chlorobiota bacterium]